MLIFIYQPRFSCFLATCVLKNNVLISCSTFYKLQLTPYWTVMWDMSSLGDHYAASTVSRLLTPGRGDLNAWNTCREKTCHWQKLIVREAKLLFILSMCITAEGDLEQIRRDYQGLVIMMEDIGGQVLFMSQVGVDTLCELATTWCHG